MGIHSVFATNLRHFRKEQGLTQEELAEKSGLHRTYIGGIEQERINLSLKNIETVAKALEIDPAYFFFLSNDKNQESCSTTNKQAGCNSYALLHETSQGIEITPLSVINQDLSIQILYTLIQEGFSGEALVAEYNKTQKEIIESFKRSRKYER